MGPSAVADGERRMLPGRPATPTGFNGAVGGSRRRGEGKQPHAVLRRLASMGPSAVADGET